MSMRVEDKPSKCIKLLWSSQPETTASLSPLSRSSNDNSDPTIHSNSNSNSNSNPSIHKVYSEATLPISLNSRIHVIRSSSSSNMIDSQSLKDKDQVQIQVQDQCIVQTHQSQSPNKDQNESIESKTTIAFQSKVLSRLHATISLIQEPNHVIASTSTSTSTIKINIIDNNSTHGTYLSRSNLFVQDLDGDHFDEGRIQLLRDGKHQHLKRLIPNESYEIQNGDFLQFGKDVERGGVLHGAIRAYIFFVSESLTTNNTSTTTSTPQRNHSFGLIKKPLTPPEEEEFSSQSRTNENNSSFKFYSSEIKSNSPEEGTSSQSSEESIVDCSSDKSLFKRKDQKIVSDDDDDESNNSEDEDETVYQSLESTLNTNTGWEVDDQDHYSQIEKIKNTIIISDDEDEDENENDSDLDIQSRNSSSESDEGNEEEKKMECESSKRNDEQMNKTKTLKFTAFNSELDSALDSHDEEGNQKHLIPIVKLGKGFESEEDDGEETSMDFDFVSFDRNQASKAVHNSQKSGRYGLDLDSNISDEEISEKDVGNDFAQDAKDDNDEDDDRKSVGSLVQEDPNFSDFSDNEGIGADEGKTKSKSQFSFKSNQDVISSMNLKKHNSLGTNSIKSSSSSPFRTSRIGRIKLKKSEKSKFISCSSDSGSSSSSSNPDDQKKEDQKVKSKKIQDEIMMSGSEFENESSFGGRAQKIQDFDSYESQEKPLNSTPKFIKIKKIIQSQNSSTPSISHQAKFSSTIPSSSKLEKDLNPKFSDKFGETFKNRKSNEDDSEFKARRFKIIGEPVGPGKTIFRRIDSKSVEPSSDVELDADVEKEKFQSQFDKQVVDESETHVEKCQIENSSPVFDDLEREGNEKNQEVEKMNPDVGSEVEEEIFNSLDSLQALRRYELDIQRFSSDLVDEPTQGSERISEPISNEFGLHSIPEKDTSTIKDIQPTQIQKKGTSSKGKGKTRGLHRYWKTSLVKGTKPQLRLPSLEKSHSPEPDPEFDPEFLDGKDHFDDPGSPFEWGDYPNETDGELDIDDDGIEIYSDLVEAQSLQVESLSTSNSISEKDSSSLDAVVGTDESQVNVNTISTTPDGIVNDSVLAPDSSNGVNQESSSSDVPTQDLRILSNVDFNKKPLESTQALNSSTPMVDVQSQVTEEDVEDSSPKGKGKDKDVSMSQVNEAIEKAIGAHLKTSSSSSSSSSAPNNNINTKITGIKRSQEEIVGTSINDINFDEASHLKKSSKRQRSSLTHSSDESIRARNGYLNGIGTKVVGAFYLAAAVSLATVYALACIDDDSLI